jgi:tellurite resistance protein
MQDRHPPQSLEHYPITFFAVVMGLAGTVLALRAASHAFGLALHFDLAGLIVVGTVFAGISLVYLMKWMRFPAAVWAEWNHPVRMAFFPAVTISLLLMASIALEVSVPLARGLWFLGAAGQFVLTIAVVSGWIGSRSFQHGVLSPAWFIPAVGNVIVPLAGPTLGYEELSWYFMSVGLMFWLVLLTLVFNRLVFHDPLPGRLQPTLVILIAPPAIGFVAWTRLTGEIDILARILLNSAWFFAALVAVQMPRILRLPFAMSFWALSFPVAALTVATLTYGAATGQGIVLAMGGLFLIVLGLVIVGLTYRTIRGLIAGEILQPE